MRQTVAILLNERESAKKRVAEQLEKQLLQNNITSSRMAVGPSMDRRMRELKPSVVVLDYLLGDHGTGLDIVQQLSDLPAHQRPQFFFLTDEPSIGVAVEAMRLGARNYLEIDQPQSLAVLVREINQLQRNFGSSNTAAPPPSLDEIVNSSAASRTLIGHARKSASMEAPIVILCGPHGSGRSYLAEALCNERQVVQPPLRIDYRFCADAPSRLIPSSWYSTNSSFPPHALDLILDEADDSADLLEFLIGAGHKIRKPHRLIVILSDAELAKGWSSALAAPIISVPPLSERSEDIPSYVQRFVREAATLRGVRLKSPSPADLKAIAGMKWPGNVSQLKSAIYTASWDEEWQTDLVGIIKRYHDDYQTSLSGPPVDITPTAAAIALANNQFCIRATAATLGLTVRTLRDLVDQGAA